MSLETQGPRPEDGQEKTGEINVSGLQAELKKLKQKENEILSKHTQYEPIPQGLQMKMAENKRERLKKIRKEIESIEGTIPTTAKPTMPEAKPYITEPAKKKAAEIKDPTKPRVTKQARAKASGFGKRVKRMEFDINQLQKEFKKREQEQRQREARKQRVLPPEAGATQAIDLSEIQAQPPKKEKKGFFSKLFGGKK